MSKEKNSRWVAWMMRNYRLTFLVVGLMFILGIYGLDKMPKAEFPDFTLRTGVVVGVYPGATSEEVEEQLVRPLERYLVHLQGGESCENHQHEPERDLQRHGGAE